MPKQHYLKHNKIHKSNSQPNNINETEIEI